MMKVILMTDVPALGQRGETRDVANGYARNFLLPRKLAVPATPANLKNVEHLKRQRAREEERALETAKATAERIEGLTLAVTARASEDGRLYGSVSPQDVVEFLERHKISVEKRRVAMDEPIKAVGDYKVSVRLHGDVTAALTVTVKAE
jgi:large subunit ribosomal protein L9